MRVNQKQAGTDSAKVVGAVTSSASFSVNPAISEAVARMGEEEERLRGEISRLQAELAAVQRARVALERGGRASVVAEGAVSGRVRLRAPRGFLPRRIVEVVAAGAGPLSRAQIIEQLRGSGYEFTLAPAAITRELVALVRARRLKREGADNAARYVAVARGKRRG